MEKTFCKRALLYFLIVAVAISLISCKAGGVDETHGLIQTTEMTNISTTAPTEPELSPIVIFAPFDNNYDPTQAKGIDLQIKEGYQFLIRDENYKNMYRNPLSSYYSYIMTVPMILEDSMQDAQLEYEFRTNCGSLITDKTRMVEHYAGQTAIMVNEYMIWRGQDELGRYLLPKENMQDAHIWLDIVARKDGKPVGFAVYQIVYEAIEERVWSSVYRYSEFYPTAEAGAEITEEFVNARIEACHQYFMNNAE